MEGFETTLYIINIVLLLSNAWFGDAVDFDQVIGNVVGNRQYMDNPIVKDCIWMPDPTSYATIDYASVTKWKFYTRKSGTVVLQIWRPGATQGQFTLVGSSSATVHGAGLHYLRPRALSIYPVMRGDVIAVYMPQENIIPFSAKHNLLHCRESWYSRTNGSLFLRNARTQSVNFISGRQRWGPCRRYSVRAFLQEVGPITTTSSPNTKLPTTQVATTKTVEQCCFDVYPGKSLIFGRVMTLAVFALSPTDCASKCCKLEDCRSFSARKPGNRPFCFLYLSSRDDDSTELKKNAQFVHQEKKQCV